MAQNVFDVLDAIETNVKADSELWSDNPDDSFSGFRQIFKSLADTDSIGSDSSFPILVLDAQDTLVMDSSNCGYAPSGGVLSISVYTMSNEYGDGYEKKKLAGSLIDKVLELINMEVVDSVSYISSYLEGYKVFAGVAVVEY